MTCYNACEQASFHIDKRANQEAKQVEILAICLQVLGALGTCILLALTGAAFWYHRGCRMGSFRWHMRNQHLKHLSALACLFFLAMTASYAVLHQVWALFYFVIACKVATWWLRLTITQRT